MSSDGCTECVKTAGRWKIRWRGRPVIWWIVLLLNFVFVDVACFFFQAEDGIRDHCVTGVQTCALPISTMRRGGIFMYAFDVTNPTAPKLLWRKGSTDTGWEQQIGRASCRERV